MTYYDPTTVYSNKKKYVIWIEHQPTKKHVQFPAFLTDFKDSVQSQNNNENDPGKITPISTHVRTTRTISFTIEVVSDSLDQATRNYYRMRKLALFHFPTRKVIAPGGSALALATAESVVDKSKPLVFRIRFANLITDSKGLGLLGQPGSFVISPKIEHGFFEGEDTIYAKTYELSMTLDIINEELVLASSANSTATTTGGSGNSTGASTPANNPTPTPARSGTGNGTTATPNGGASTAGAAPTTNPPPPPPPPPPAPSPRAPSGRVRI